MSRAALTTLLAMLLALAAAGAPVIAGALSPHLDPGMLPAGCTACHQGHGLPRSPMLPDTQVRLCLTCHGSLAGSDRLVSRGVVSAIAKPALLSAVLARPFVHPMNDHAFSRRECLVCPPSGEPRAVVCTSCHSPHRLSEGPAAGFAPGGTKGAPGFPGHRKPSPRDPSRFEFELCESCHGSGPMVPQGANDVGRLLDPGNRSYHPVEAPAIASSPSVIPALEGGEINCSDCHGNSDHSGPRGPHGSGVRYLLRFEYTTVDGLAESAAAYSLCYQCHRREAVLGGSPFPEHGSHVAAERSSCATCHQPHGSVANRALIRFGETTIFGTDPVAPAASGRLAFESAAAGSGACYLTCHGHNHDPESYGLGFSKETPWTR